MLRHLDGLGRANSCCAVASDRLLAASCETVPVFAVGRVGSSVYEALASAVDAHVEVLVGLLAVIPP